MVAGDVAHLAGAFTGIPFGAGVLRYQHDGANPLALLLDSLCNPWSDIGVGWIEPGPGRACRGADKVPPVYAQGVDIWRQVFLAQGCLRQGCSIEDKLKFPIECPEKIERGLGHISGVGRSC
ncbi:hypothetical protein D3C85_1266210 [compost metagenome]